MNWAHKIGESAKLDAKKRNNQLDLHTILGNQALILQAWGKLEEAMELHKKQEGTCQQLGDQAGLVICYWNSGILYREMELHEMAVDKLKAVIEIEKRLKLPRLEQFRKYLAAYMEELEGTVIGDQ